jgi:hypothetical protein
MDAHQAKDLTSEDEKELNEKLAAHATAFVRAKADLKDVAKQARTWLRGERDGPASEILTLAQQFLSQADHQNPNFGQKTFDWEEFPDSDSESLHSTRPVRPPLPENARETIRQRMGTRAPPQKLRSQHVFLNLPAGDTWKSQTRSVFARIAGQFSIERFVPRSPELKALDRALQEYSNARVDFQMAQGSLPRFLVRPENPGFGRQQRLEVEYAKAFDRFAETFEKLRETHSACPFQTNKRTRSAMIALGIELEKNSTLVRSAANSLAELPRSIDGVASSSGHGKLKDTERAVEQRRQQYESQFPLVTIAPRKRPEVPGTREESSELRQHGTEPPSRRTLQMRMKRVRHNDSTQTAAADRAATRSRHL